jgi:hypothetical protein
MEPLTIKQPRPALVRRIAGALAETSTGSLTLQTPGGRPEQLVARNTDLPAKLSSTPVGTLLTTPAGCTITLTAEGCTVADADKMLLEALDPISR